MLPITDIELRTMLLSNNSVVACWNDKDETMQDYIVQLFQEAASLVAVDLIRDDGDGDDDHEENRNLETTVQEYVRENILPFVMDDSEYEDESGKNVGETLVQQLAASLIQLLELKQKQQQQKQTIDGANIICDSSSSSPSSTVDPSLPKVAPRLDQEAGSRPFTLRTMLKEKETSAVPPTDVAPTNSGDSGPSKKEKLTRRTRQDKKSKQKLVGASSSAANKEQQQQQQQQHREEFVEDDATAWQECLQMGKQWGGRGHGGRGEYAAAVNSIRSNIHLTNVTISLPSSSISSSKSSSGGGDLLQNATMDIQRGHRYGLIGRNGCGKSTLLHRLANFQIPGMPTDMRILLVQQQVDGSDTDTPLQVLLQADIERTRLLQEQQRLEHILDTGSTASLTEEKGGASSSSSSSSNHHGRTKDDCETTTMLAEAAERWSDIAVELEAIEADRAEERGLEILRGLGFTAEMLASPTSQLSGGWRMRLALAKSLFVPGVDLLLFDECTNHLDLAGLDWLMNHLSNSDKTKTGGSTRNDDRTLIVVSHDRTFLNAVCTDIIHMEHQKLTYHPGNYADYERTMEEKTAREAQILDASARQRSKAQAFVQKQQQQANKKSADPNKQRQAKMIKEKKMDRIGNYRQDGKRYKQFSLATLSEDSIRLAEKVEVRVQEAVVQMNFPNPSWPPGIGPNEDIVRMENLSFGYMNENNGDNNNNCQPLLRNVTASLHRGSKVALVGSNGAGKTTLMRLIAGELVLSKNPTSHRTDGTSTTGTTMVASHGGEFWRHGNLRIGHVTQYSVEELERDHASKTVVAYAEERLKSGKASASIVAKHSGNVRQYLGAFGLGGRHALQTIGKLSGGERMRLCFATVLAESPHLLLMDESTNHVDIETLDSMSRALDAYEGSVLMVSHNQGFLSGFCTELWVIEEGGRLTVNHSDTDSFDEIFSQYRTAVAAAGGQSLSDKRRQTANLAKKASMQQRSGARTNTALL